MFKKTQRQLQVGEQIKRLIADIILEDDHFLFPGVQLSIAQADISADLKNAKIFVNIFGKADKAKVIEKLNLLAPYLRSKLAKQLAARYVPVIIFVFDETQEKADKILHLIDKEAKSNQPK